MLTVKNFDVPAHEPLRSRNQYFPAWIAAVAEPQNFVAGLPPTFVFPGTQPRLRARPAPAVSETASRRAMPAVRAISARRLRGRA
jgi:acetyl esterase/lipase